ncbi:MAG: SIR2 family protein, partial [Pseudomonadota bacterium]|nr:SIR2 family protein [Pseudomonadota bacterium]
GIVPLVNEITEYVRNNKEKVELEIGCDSEYEFTGDEKDLYKWADVVFEKLVKDVGDSHLAAKHKIAKAIKVLDNPRFLAKINIPIRGATFRHRVVARLAREGRWHVIWSLNWDVVLEAALQSVGLINNEKGQPPERLPSSWPEWYTTWTQPQINPGESNKVIRVMKPHGCVEKLSNGNDTFLMTISELDNIKTSIKENNHNLVADFNSKPLISIGWRVAEDYIREILEECYQANSLAKKDIDDTLSIVDIKKWSEYHDFLLEKYGMDEGSSFFEVKSKECPTTDDLFVWIQTIFGLNCLMYISAAANREIGVLQKLLEDIKDPECESWLNSWFDNFLSTWVLLCFKSKKVTFNLAAQPIRTSVVPTHRRDEHIPWSDGSVPRKDLLGASYLLSAMAESAKEWNMTEYPGGIWDEENRHLVLPLPAWERNNNINLMSLRSLSDGWHWGKKGAIKQLSILPIFDEKPEEQLEEAVVMNWKSQVASLMDTTSLSKIENIGLLNLEDIENAS